MSTKSTAASTVKPPSDGSLSPTMQGAPAPTSTVDTARQISAPADSASADPKRKYNLENLETIHGLIEGYYAGTQAWKDVTEFEKKMQNELESVSTLAISPNLILTEPQRTTDGDASIYPGDRVVDDDIKWMARTYDLTKNSHWK